jgi:hypothetical protein
MLSGKGRPEGAEGRDCRASFLREALSALYLCEEKRGEEERREKR